MGSTPVDIEALMGMDKKTGISGVVGTINITLPGLVKNYSLEGGDENNEHPINGPHPTDINPYTLGAMLYFLEAKKEQKPAPTPVPIGENNEHPINGPHPTDIYQ